MITLAPPTLDLPAIATRRGLAFVRVRDDLWRVTRTGGDVLGYLEVVAGGGSIRYRAKRMAVRLQRFVEVGEFWTVDDAVDSLRY